MAATVFLYVKVPKGFFPQQDTGRMNRLAPGRSEHVVQGPRAEAQQVHRHTPRRPGGGLCPGFAGGGSTLNTARLFANLKPLEERKISADQVLARLRPKLATVPGASLYLQPGQDLRVGGRSSGAQFQYTLQADSNADLELWGPRVLERLRKLREVADVNSDQSIKGLEVALDIDRLTASRLGVTTSDIDNTL
jgi:multidrug efflux pump